MPGKSGRSGEPGNSTSYKPIRLHTPKPGLLQPGKAKSTIPVGSVLGGGKVPGKEKRFNYATKRGVR